MKDNKHKIIFNHGECISEDVLLRYVNDQLSAKEKHVVEKHTLGCDMCADALEGLMMMKEPSQLKGIVESLNKKISGTGEERKPIILWMDTRVRVAIAAGLALLIGFYFLFNTDLNETSDNKTVSDNLKQKKEPDQIVIDKEKRLKEDSTSIDQRIVTGKEVESNLETKKNKKTGEATKSGSGNNAMGGNAGDELKNLKAQDGLAKTDNAPPPQDLQEQKQKEGFDDVTTLDRSKVADKKVAPQKKPETIVDKDAKDVNGKYDETGLGKVTTTNESPNAPVQTHVNTEGDKYYSFKNIQAPKKEEKIVSKGENRKDKKKTSEYAESQKQPDEKNNSNGAGNNGYTSVPQSTVQSGNNSNTVSPNPVPQNNTGSQDIISLSNELETDTAKKFAGLLDSISYRSAISAGEKKYELKDYAGAVTIYSKTIATQPNDREALYHLGDSYLQLNKPDMAIIQFDKLIKLGSGKYYDDARYDKSLALMKQNKNAEAKKLLEDIEKTSTEYKTRAAKSLDKIK